MNSMNPPRAPRLLLSREDRVKLDDRYFRVEEVRRQGVILVGEDGLRQEMCFDQILALIDIDRLHVESQYFALPSTRARMEFGEVRFGDLSPEDQQWALYRTEWVKRVNLLRATGHCTLSDKSLKRIIPQVYAAINADGLNGADARVGRAKRKRDAPASVDEAEDRIGDPSPSWLRYWIREAAEFGDLAIAQSNRYRRSGNRSHRLDDDRRRILKEEAAKYASDSRPTGIEIHRRVNDRIDELNAGRRAVDLDPLDGISRKTVYREINKTDRFTRLVGREGLDKAKRLFFPVHEGIRVDRPLARVEIDDSKRPIFVLLEDRQVLNEMSEKERRKVKRARVWLTAAIDVATECLLAAIVSDHDPNGNSALAAIHMTTLDKTNLLAGSALKSTWIMRGTLEMLVADRGSCYLRTDVRATVAALSAQYALGPSGMPQMRGRIERFHATLEQILESHFPGRTFSDPMVRGDYNSVGEASLTIGELRSLIPVAVEAYHHTPHGGLGGKTPYNAWVEKLLEHEVLPPPSPSMARHIFGLKHPACRIDNRGVRHLGLYYQSRALQEMRHDPSVDTVTVSVNPMDLGIISVKHPEKGFWISVPSVESFAKGLTLEHWARVGERLRARNKAEAKVARTQVIEALKIVRELAETVREKAGLGQPWRSERRRLADQRELFKVFDMYDERRSKPSEEDILGIAEERDGRIGVHGEPVLSSGATFDILGHETLDTNADDDRSQFGDAGDWSTEH